MAEKKPAEKASRGFTVEERAAMRERAKELKAAASAGKGDAEGSVCEGRQRRVFLSGCAEVQGEVRNAGLQRQGES